jgi:hypothetical protein
MEFYQEIVDYKEKCKKAAANGKPKPKIPDKIAMRLLLIAENTSKKPCYSGYTFRDIMVADAVENCIRYFDNFDLNRPEKNPFGYFTQYCIYAFGRRIFLEKRELYTKYKIAQQSGIMEEFGGEEGEDGPSIPSEQLYDNINEFIDKFENNLAKAKAKENKPKKGLERLTENENLGPDGV